MDQKTATTPYEELSAYLERGMALQTALILLEWDNETLAPEKAGSYTTRVQGSLSAAYQEVMTNPRVKELVEQCQQELEAETAQAEAAVQPEAVPSEKGKSEIQPLAAGKPEVRQSEAGQPESAMAAVMEKSGAGSSETTEKPDARQISQSEIQRAILREAKEEIEQLSCIPPEEYRDFQELTAESTRIWAKARKEDDFDSFAPVLEKIISYQKKFAGYRAKEGQKLYDVMLDTYEKGFDMEKLDEFFTVLKSELVPFLKQIKKSGVRIDDAFLTGDYPEVSQRELAENLARYVGFDLKKGVLATSAHPFTTNLHNHDVRITTHYKDRMDSSLFSVIHEAGHGVYEMGIDDALTQTLVGQGASMGMHESQSRFFENIIGRSEAFWVPLYANLKELFPEQLKGVGREMFVRAINKVEPGLIRTEADELTYSLHVLVRYELEKALIEEDLPVQELPELWADKYEEYLGVRPKKVSQGVLQDIHWAQGSFGYFPSYALGSAFGAQMYACMKRELEFDRLLEEQHVDVIREYLREHIHRFGKLRTSRQLLYDMTGEDFDPKYYIDYLKEKYGKIYLSVADR